MLIEKVRDSTTAWASLATQHIKQHDIHALNAVKLFS